MDEELDLEGRPSRFTRIILHHLHETNEKWRDGNDKVVVSNSRNADDDKGKATRQKWRKTGTKVLSADFRDNF